MPRAELSAAVLNTHTGEVVKRAFKQDHISHKFTDSQISLHWICNERRPLKQWVRNRVIEIQRFTSKDDWKYIKSSDMIADIGTRRNSSLDIINPNSPWFRGYEWMTKPASEFPVLSAKDISLNQTEHQEAKKEVPHDYESIATSLHVNSMVPDQVRERYAFSSYIINPHKHRFSVVVHIVAIVIKFVKNLQSSLSKKRSIEDDVDPKSLVLSTEEVMEAEQYFFKKGSSEVKKFNTPSKYFNISREKSGIIIYTGRILPTDSVTIIGKATQTMIDLHSTSFCVPILDRYSPISYSLVNEIHWNHVTASHSGVETTWRYVLKKAYILEGRILVKIIRSTCERCRYLLKRTIDISMGPVSPHNLMIAPIFYTSQVDLCGPFSTYSYHNKRATIKIWFVVFCCSTTTTINIKCLEDYSSNAFLQAFTRFSCEVGYPKHLLTDEGSQLIKACETVQFNYRDIQWKLFTENQVEFDTCPVGGHNMNGLVERKIREIKSSISKSLSKERLSILQWETFCARAANCINDLPLGVRDYDGHLEALDIITPNQLRLGRNNDRSPVGNFDVSNNSSKIIRQNQEIFNTWFELWLTTHVPGLVAKPKWYKSEVNLKKGDFVLFTKQDTVLCSTYQFGIVNSVEFGRDGKVRKVHVRYQNHNENSQRITFRSVRNLVVIHRIDETCIMKDLHDASMAK